MRGFQPAKGKAKTFANGGPVRGPGTGTSDEVADTVPNGTYIMPADSTQAVGQDQLAGMGAGSKGVPVQLSKGEFKLPPEQVHAIGVQALDQMKNATHTPVAPRGFSAGAVGAPQQPEPPLFFADGGVVDEEERRRQTSPANTFPGSRLPGDSGFSSAPGGPAVPPAPVPAPAMPATTAPSPSNIFPGNRLQGGSGSSGAPVQPPVVPAPAVPTPAPAAPPAARGMNDAQRTTALSQIPTDGPIAPPATTGLQPAQVAAPAVGAQAAGDRAKLGAVWDTIKDVNNDAGRAIADVAMMIPRGLAGAYDTAVVRPMRAAGVDAAYLSPSLVPDGVDPASMTPYTDQKRLQQAQAASATVAPTGSASSAPAAATSPASLASAGVPAPAATVSAPAQPAVATTAAPAAGATEVMPGVFRSGNSYAGTADAAVAGAAPRGMPNAGAMAAAEAIYQRQQAAALQAPRGFAPPAPQYIAPQVPTSANDWETRNNLRNLEVSASSITNNGGRFDSRQGTGRGRGRDGVGGMSAAQIAYTDALREDLAARGMQPGMDNATNQINAGVQREAMQQTGSNQRNAADNLVRAADATARGFVDRGRLSLDQKKQEIDAQVRGFEIREATRREELAKRYDAAKTAEEKSAIAQQIRDLSGKQSESPWKVQVTPAIKNPDGSTSEGSIYRYNTHTGQVERADAGASAPAAAGVPKIGDTRNGYRYKGGNPNDQGNWEKV